MEGVFVSSIKKVFNPWQKFISFCLAIAAVTLLCIIVSWLGFKK
jgi:hypothetical protein